MFHRNTAYLNSSWKKLSYLSPRATFDFLSELSSSLSSAGSPEHRQRIRQNYFISAEGAYSSIVFSLGEIRILIAGRMFDDKNMKPVIAKVSPSVVA
jgi:hypothetical protein